MIAALFYLVIPPVILGRLKKPIATRMRDKALLTDALMQKADWQTGLAGIAGVLGIDFGLWWADSLAALLISLSILRDGLRSLRGASAELMDVAPRELGSDAIFSEAVQLQDRLIQQWPNAIVRLRESGRYIMASVEGVNNPGSIPNAAKLMGDAPDWRLGRLTFSPPQRNAPGENWIADKDVKD